MTLLNKLKQILTSADAPTEEDSEYDGLFSYSGEVHAFVIGLGGGLAAAVTGETWIMAVLVGAVLGEEIAAGEKALGEFRNEPWYGFAGLAIGFVLATVLTPLLA